MFGKAKALGQGKVNNHSDRCSVNYKIEIARAVSHFTSFGELDETSVGAQLYSQLSRHVHDANRSGMSGKQARCDTEDPVDTFTLGPRD